MRITVLGCGAMGSIYAALLASCGNDVSAVDSNEAHVRAINEKGLRVSGASGDRTVNIKAYTQPPAEPADLLVIAVKGNNVKSAASIAAPMVNEDSLILTIQNGLGSADIVADYLAEDRLIVGVAQGFGASLPEPGHANHNDMKAIRMGAYSSLEKNAVSLVASCFRNAGFDAQYTHDIAAMQWEKLICNVAYSALSGLTGMTVGQVMDDPIIGPLSRNAAKEAWQVARALGIGISIEDPVQHVRDFASRMPDARPSVLLDIMADRFSEIDIINGAVKREAEKAGTSAPVNATLTSLVQSLEHRTIAANNLQIKRNLMAHLDELMIADAARRSAMISADLDALTSLLHDDLVWTHSSGRTDGRSALLESIASGSVAYESLDVSEPRISQQDDIFIYSGIVKGNVQKDGVPKSLENKFLSVWKKSGTDYQMLAWQSTGI